MHRVEGGAAHAGSPGNALGVRPADVHARTGGDHELARGVRKAERRRAAERAERHVAEQIGRPPSPTRELEAEAQQLGQAERRADAQLTERVRRRRVAYLGVLHPAGALVDYVTVGESIWDVARFPAAHAWVVINRLGALRRYDALDPLGDPIPLGDIWVGSGVALVALKSRLVAVVPTREGVSHATFAGSELEPIGAGLLVRPGTYRSEYGVDEVGVATAATAMRDTVVAIAMDRTDLWSVVYDPFRGEVVSGPMRSARSPAYLGHDVAGDHEGGTVGVCYPDGDAPYGGYHGDPPSPGPAPDRVRFALLGPDGAPLGPPVTIASGLFNAVSCSIACVGRDRYGVALWDADGLDPGFAIFAATVRVRR